MKSSPAEVRSAIRHLRRVDTTMDALIEQVGAYRLQPRRGRFAAIVRAIIGQQISTRAAASIYARLLELVDSRMTADRLLALDAAQLRSAGVSPQKLVYLKDLAGKWSSGKVRHRRFARMTDEQVIDELVQVKGIGRWTAQMFLIFSLGRLDVFPPDDLGIRMAIRNLYGLSELPDRAAGEAIAEPWHPYASVASWYCWRSLDS